MDESRAFWADVYSLEGNRISMAMSFTANFTGKLLIRSLGGEFGFQQPVDDLSRG
jgi:hypothetical protein